MKIFTKADLEELAKVRGEHCISIYIPTHQRGAEVNEGQDSIMFKNQLQEIENKLEEKGLDNRKIDTMLRDARNLLEDGEFWRHQWNGLAMFITEDYFRYYRLPMNFNAKNMVNHSFHLKELIPMFGGNGTYFVLALSLSKVRFFEANRDEIFEVNMEENAPNGMKQVLKYYEMEQSLQYRSQVGNSAGTASAANYHGQGGGKDNRDAYVNEYLRLVDDAVNEVIYDYHSPMIIVSVDYLQPMFRKVSQHNNIVDTGINGNPDQMSAKELHEKTWKVMKDHFDKRKDDHRKHYGDLAGTGKTSYDINQIVPAALNGRIETLFVKEDSQHMWGVFNKDTQNVELHDNRGKEDECMVSMSAVETILNGGETYIVSADELPEQSVDADMVAVFRY
ncbi:hypothetical protein AB9P05_19115 [Roseivirga sp. BDSF3-8]|uniref:baeRF3 domain-containing protein n=1 Tax=Roseivirga sp. BDSF3-8 TaxID=3241598 RepID=UPI003531F8C2